MPNITVFRVTSKSKKKGKSIAVILFVLLIAVAWLFAKVCLASIVSLKVQGSNIIQSTDGEVFKGFIDETLPVAKRGSIAASSTQTTVQTGGILLPVSFLDGKSVLNIQYPVLKAYYSKPETKITVTPDNQSESDTELNQSGQVSLPDESESENIPGPSSQPGTAKKDKIYSSSTVVKSGTIAIRNHTTYKINIEKLRTEPLKLNAPKGSTKVIILNTHTSEAYTPSKGYQYTSSDYFRTGNPRFNVSRVSKELNTQFSKYGVKSFCDATVHDSPTYTGSYERSLKTVLKDMKKYPSAKIVLDIHRDAAGEPDEKLRRVIQIGNKNVARLMFVVGTDQMGLKHPRWMENLKFAIKLQDKANKLFPGICQEIDLRKERFNQHVAPGAIIVEVGGTGNTMEEAVESMKYLARIVSEVTK